MELKDSLRKIRKECGITQEAAAEALGVSAQSVSKWERGLCSPDVNLLPRIALLYNCSLDRLFGLDTAVVPNSTAQAVEVRRLEAAGDYGGIFSLYLRECEGNRDDFHRFLQLLRFADMHNLFDHPNLPQILPLFYYCERYCPDADLLNQITAVCLVLAGKSSNPILHNKAREFHQRLPCLLSARERYDRYVMQGAELRQKMHKNLLYGFDTAFGFLHHMAENAETTEEQIRLHNILCKTYETLSEGKFCGIFDGMFLNSYHKMAWKHMQLGQRKEAEACVNTIIQRLRQHLSTEARNRASDLFCANPEAAAIPALQLLHRMERHPDLAPFREKIKAFREEYESGMQAFKKDNP